MNKVDKGFCLQYSRLSDRRKFIRTLWMIPWLAAMFLVPEETRVLGVSRNVWIVAALTALIFQTVRTYRAWNGQSGTSVEGETPD